MKLHELKASAGARKAVTRKGRGAGSGNGKTAGVCRSAVSTTFSQPSMLPSRCLTSRSSRPVLPLIPRHC